MNPIRLDVPIVRRIRSASALRLASEHRTTSGINAMQVRLTAEGTSEYLIEVIAALREHCEWADDRIAALERIVLPHGRAKNGKARTEPRYSSRYASQPNEISHPIQTIQIAETGE